MCTYSVVSVEISKENLHRRFFPNFAGSTSVKAHLERLWASTSWLHQEVPCQLQFGVQAIFPAVVTVALFSSQLAEGPQHVFSVPVSLRLYASDSHL